MRTVLGPVLRWLGGLTLAFAVIIGIQTFKTYVKASLSDRTAAEYEQKVEAAGPAADTSSRDLAAANRRRADNDIVAMWEMVGWTAALVAGGVVPIGDGTMIDWHSRRRGPKGLRRPESTPPPADA